MADQQRVQFREWLTQDALRRLDAQGAVPLFSPTAVGDAGGGTAAAAEEQDRRDKENLPPSDRGRGTPARPQQGSPNSTGQETLFFSPLAGPPPGDEDDGDLVSDGSSLTLETAPSLRLRLHLHRRDPLELTPFSGITHSTLRPVVPLTVPSSRESAEKECRSDAAAPARTPRNTPPPPSYTPPLAVVASTPYKSLPRLDMLSAEFVRSCDDAATLRHVVAVLQQSSGDDPRHKQRFPHLLRIAEERYEALAAGREGGGESRGGVPTALAPATAPTAASLPPALPPSNAASLPDDSLTLSTDSGMGETSSLRLLREALVGQLPDARWDRRPTPRGLPTPNSSAGLQQPPRHHSQSSPAGVHPAEPPSPWNRQLHQSETRLRRTEREVDALQQLLRTSAARHDKSTRELQQALAELHGRLEGQSREAEAARTQEVAWRDRATHLAEQLDEQKAAHQRAAESWESKHRQLSEFLKSSQRHLEGVSHERAAMLQKMRQALLGADGGAAAPAFEVDKLTKEERDRIVSDFCAHLADAKLQVEELAAAVRETEKERRKLHKAYQRAKERCGATQECLLAAERDNHLLAAEAERLAQLLREAQAVAEQAMMQQSQWEKRQRESNAVIRRLKEQVRTSETMVPIGVYKSALQAADAHAAKAEEYRQRVTDLTSQVSNLTARVAQRPLSHAKAAPLPTPPPPPPPQSAATLARVLQPKDVAKATGHTPSTNSKAFQTPHITKKPPPKSVTPPPHKPPPSRNIHPVPIHVTTPAKENQPNPASSGRKAVTFAQSAAAPEPASVAAVSATKLVLTTTQEPRSATKIALLRAAGGRKGLEEQLRRIRSPRNQLQSPPSESARQEAF